MVHDMMTTRRSRRLLWPLCALALLCACQDGCEGPKASKAPLRASEDATPKPPSLSLEKLAQAEFGQSTGTALSWRSADGGVRLAVALKGAKGVAWVDNEGKVTRNELEVTSMGALVSLPPKGLAVLDRAGRVFWRDREEGQWGSLEVGRGPRDVIEAANRTWVLTQDGKAPLVELGASMKAEVTRHQVPGSTPSTMAWDEKHGTLWLANFVSHDLTPVKPGAGPGEAVSVGQRLPVSTNPYRLLMDRDSGKLVVMHANSAELQVVSLDAAEGKAVARPHTLAWIPSDMVRVGSQVAWLGAGAGRLFVSSVGSLASPGPSAEGVEVPVGSTGLLALRVDGRNMLAVSTGHKGEVQIWEVSGQGMLTRRAEVSTGFATGRLVAVEGEPSQFWVTGPVSGRVARYALRATR